MIKTSSPLKPAAHFLVAEIKRYNYPNDKLYYKKIMDVKQIISKSFLSLTKSEKNKLDEYSKNV